jgi:hypothetical protein
MCFKKTGKFGYDIVSTFRLLEIPVGVGFHFILFPNLMSFEYIVTVVVHLNNFLFYLFFFWLSFSEEN